MRIAFLATCLFCLFVSGCQSPPSIEGLWVVQSVTVGTEEMTPNARWMRFNGDLTHESGNGWLQHSVGTWQMDPGSQLLDVTTDNGLTDPYGPFSVTLTEERMIWKRVEEGDSVQVDLARADKLPMTFGDQLLGLWQLEEVTGEGSYFSASQPSIQYLFLRWDRRFVIGSSSGRTHGVYNVHGHKPELEFIPYSQDHPRNFWRVAYGDESITLTALNTDSTVVRSFKRIDKFPE